MSLASSPRYCQLTVCPVKSNASLIFKRLKELSSRYRMVMTGVPLNNHIWESLVSCVTSLTSKCCPSGEGFALQVAAGVTASTAASTTTASSNPGMRPPLPPSSNPHSPLPVLKHSNSPSLPASTMDPDLPPAPQIDGEAMLELFVHPSIRFTGVPLNSEDSPYGDRKRLAILGGKALEAVFTHLLFDKRPMMTAGTLDCEVRELPELVEKWVEGYKWREKVRHAKDVDIRTPEETRYLMDAYVGAVFVGGGYRAVLNWIAALVDPSAAPPDQQGQHAEPDLKRFKGKQPQQMPPFFQSPGLLLPSRVVDK